MFKIALLIVGALNFQCPTFSSETWNNGSFTVDFRLARISSPLSEAEHPKTDVPQLENTEILASGFWFAHSSLLPYYCSTDLEMYKCYMQDAVLLLHLYSTSASRWELFFMVHKAKSSCYIWTYVRNPHFIALAVLIKQLLLILSHWCTSHFSIHFRDVNFKSCIFIGAHLAVLCKRILLLQHFLDICHNWKKSDLGKMVFNIATIYSVTC